MKQRKKETKSNGESRKSVKGISDEILREWRNETKMKGKEDGVKVLQKFWFIIN